MTTYINVITGSRTVVDTNREQVQANRTRQALREAARSSRQPSRTAPVAISKGRRPRATAEEPGAFRRASSPALGHLWVFREPSSFVNNGIVWEYNQGRNRTTTYYQNAFTYYASNQKLVSGRGAAQISVPSILSPVQLLPVVDDFGVYRTWSEINELLDPSDPMYRQDFTEYKRTANIHYRKTYLQNGFAIPCGRGCFIYVSMQAYAYYALNALLVAGIYPGLPPHPAQQQDPRPSYYLVKSTTEVKGGSRQNRAFLCSNEAIREIAIPINLAAVLAVYNPPVTYVPQTISFYGALQANDTYFAPTVSIPQVLVDAPSYASSGFLTTAAETYTPEIFSALNDVAPFVPESRIKQFPSAKAWTLSDQSKTGYHKIATPLASGGYRDWAAVFNDGDALDYGTWRIAGEYPDPEQYSQIKPQPRSGLHASASRPAVQVPDQGQQYLRSNLIAVWDWGDPAYCRSMCTALGFSDADLTP